MHEIYQQIVAEAQSKLQAPQVLGCALGPKCLAVSSVSGIGFACVSRRLQEKNDDRDLRNLERESIQAGMSELITWYTAEDEYKAAIGLAAINSVLGCTGEPFASDWTTLLHPEQKLCMVGYFCTMIERIRKTGADLTIFELLDLPGTLPPSEAANLMPTCDIVFVTGSSLANRTFHTYLPYFPKNGQVCIFGPSTPLSDALALRFHLGSSRADDWPQVDFSIRSSCGFGSMWHVMQKTGRRAAC